MRETTRGLLAYALIGLGIGFLAGDLEFYILIPGIVFFIAGILLLEYNLREEIEE